MSAPWDSGPLSPATIVLGWDPADRVERAIRVDANGNLILSSSGVVRPTARAGASRRVAQFQALSQTAVFAGSTWIYGAAFFVTEFSELLVLCSVSGGTGMPAGVKLVLQVYEPINSVWVDHPQGQFTLTAPPSTGGIGAAAYTNIGDSVRCGVFATTPWTAGTVNLTVKAKG